MVVERNANVTRTALNNIYANQKVTKFEKAKDAFTKGFQLNVCYQDDWNEISNIFDEFDVEHRDHGPLVTMNELKYTKLTRDIVHTLMKHQEICELASPNGLIRDSKEHNDLVKKRLFITILRVLPEYCRQKASKEFEDWITTNDAEQYLKALFDINGTLKQVDKKIDSVVTDIIIGGK